MDRAHSDMLRQMLMKWVMKQYWVMLGGLSDKVTRHHVNL
jgi:hypothetical protein